MKIAVRVKPNSKEEAVEKAGEGEFILRVKAPAREGRANEAVVALLAGYFAIPKARVRITRGHKGKNKIVSVT